MTKKAIIIIAAVVAALAVIAAGVVLIVKGGIGGNKNRNANEPEEAVDESILACVTKSDLDEYIGRNSNTEYYCDDTEYYFPNERVVDTYASVDVFLDGEKINYLSALKELSLVDEPEQHDDDHAHEQGEAEDHTIHDDTEEEAGAEPGADDGAANTPEPPTPLIDYSEAERVLLEEKFSDFLKAFAGYLGCREFSEPDMVPARVPEEGEQIPDDPIESFFKGFYIREYSVRDSKGVLWIVRTEASFGTASITILKILDETGYDGFIPAIDMTKTYE